MKISTLAATAVLSLAAFTACSTPAPPAPASPTSEAVPSSCLAALDEADKGFSIFAGVMDIVADSYDAIARGDWAEVSELAEGIGAKTDDLKALDYKAQRDACRAEAKNR